jgi:UDP-N-acetylmuramoyl-L-alanyl-D-glutamate--2,6-diaminopimelate ligase
MVQRLQFVTALRTLLNGIVDVPIPESLHVTGLSVDSRSIKGGDLFLGVPGIDTDGRSYIQQAVSDGAAAIVLEAHDNLVEECAVPSYQVKNLRQYIGLIANRFYGFPSRLLYVVGFTGTNGKSTCAGLVAQALEVLGRRCGLIGTVGIGHCEALRPASLTTPGPVLLQRELATMVNDGLDTVCMEVSSHALDQARVSGVDFDTAVFTNLSRDHLDYHGDMRTYAATKFLLFHDYGVRNAIINTSDPFGVEFVQAGIPAKVCTFGLDESADIYPEESDVSSRGIRLKLSTPKGSISFQSSLFGRVNIINLVAVVAILLALEHTPCSIELAMSKLRPISGRMELLSSPDASVLVVVDYAHTPAALEHALRSLREYTTNQIWCVFGCGGERDLGKRSEMGAVADRLADRIVLTNDNPRSEDPLEILQQIEAGIQRNKSVSIPDRQEAISYAMSQAEFGDLVLVAGKGHETHQVMQSERRPFSDRAVVENLLEGTC